jgi:hypothetical protein
MFVTAPVFHLPMSQSKALALLNIVPMFVTADVSHALILALNEFLKLNNAFMLVTNDTSQVSISPQFAPTPQMLGFTA